MPFPTNEEALDELEAVAAPFQMPLDDDSPRFLARLRARGVLSEEDWSRIKEWMVDALRFLGEPSSTVTKDSDGRTVIDPDADPRNANWLRIASGQRRLAREAPLWATMWLWRLYGDAPEAFWRSAGNIARQLGYERYPGEDHGPGETPAVGGRVVVGVDACIGGWVVVVLSDGKFQDAVSVEAFADVIDRFDTTAAVIAVDIPIGLPSSGPREADVRAKKLLGKRGSSVFMMPPAPVMQAHSYARALKVAASLGAPGISKQSYSLRERIMEVQGFASTRPHVIEVHPEVSFFGIKGEPMGMMKRSWNGIMERRAALRAVGVDLPDELPRARLVPADDVLDAAAAAWSADRHARGESISLPEDPPRGAKERAIAIWY